MAGKKLDGEPLRGQTILIVSPQPWEHVRISKHHYAAELARRGNRVFFLAPPLDMGRPSVRLRIPADEPQVTVVEYRPFFPLSIRFHAPALYQLLMRRQVARILGCIAAAIDVVWSFDISLFADLNWFGAPLRIYHPVDAVADDWHFKPARTATVVLTVSEQIAGVLRRAGVATAVVNHGLSRAFESESARVAPQNANVMANVGYAGNLLWNAVNRALVRRLVAENPSAVFHFWGPHEGRVDERVADDALAFIHWLRSAPNVRLHGPVSSVVLAREYQAMDAFFLAHGASARDYDRSNSHKLVEYLSTGKVVVATHVSAYADRPDLVLMTAPDDDAGLVALMRETISRLAFHNAPEHQARRRRFALDNSYTRHVERIASLLRGGGGEDVLDGDDDRTDVAGAVMTP